MIRVYIRQLRAGAYLVIMRCVPCMRALTHCSSSRHQFATIRSFLALLAQAGFLARKYGNAIGAGEPLSRRPRRGCAKKTQGNEPRRSDADLDATKGDTRCAEPVGVRLLGCVEPHELSANRDPLRCGGTSRPGNTLSLV